MNYDFLLRSLTHRLASPNMDNYHTEDFSPTVVSERIAQQQTMLAGAVYSFLWCAVIWATSHLGDSRVGDKPTGRHKSVNSATIYFHYIHYFHYIGTSSSVHLWYNGITNFVIRYTAVLTWCRHAPARRSV